MAKTMLQRNEKPQEPSVLEKKIVRVCVEKGIKAISYYIPKRSLGDEFLSYSDAEIKASINNLMNSNQIFIFDPDHRFPDFSLVERLFGKNRCGYVVNEKTIDVFYEAHFKKA